MLKYQISWISLSLGLLLLGFASQASASMNVELLRADFNDKPLNVQIGTGGASVGEPVSVSTNLVAKVQAAPFSTPSLHLDAGSVAAQNARFDFIGAEEIHSGELRIFFTLRTPPVLDRFRVWIRDQVSATAIFGGLDFRPDGTVHTLESPTFITAYAPDHTLHIEYVYQVAANSYDLFINGVQMFDDRAQSSAMPDKGIGALQFGFPTSTSSEEWAVDDILVIRTPALLNADFDDKPLGVQIGTGGASVGEPLFVQPGFVAKVQAGTFASPALNVEAKTNGTSKAARFEFVNSPEIVAGELRISFRLRTAPIMDEILFSVREQGTFSRVFGTLLLSSGTIRESGDIVGTFMPGDELFFEFRYAMDAGTYDLFINRMQVLEDRSHAVTDGRGIGSIMLYATSSTTSQWVFDDIYVYQPNDRLFQNGFD